MQLPPLDALANLLALREEGDGMSGLFSDHGSWLAACWGEEGDVFTLVDTTSTPAKIVLTIGVQQAIARRTVWPDRLEVELADGSSMVLGYAGREQLYLRCSDDLPLTVDRAADGPYHRRVRGGWTIGTGTAGEIRDDCEERNRERWLAWLEDRCAAAPDLVGTERILFLRALLTLAWNRRGPLGEIEGGACLPTPFGYPGYWAADSWRIAHALADIDPTAAADQLRVQFSRQAPDGMVPDTIRASHDDENWRNTKPARAAWALDAMAAVTPSVIDEFLPHCLQQIEWWHALRRQDHDTRYRPGGADRESAIWDTGWDESLRFEALAMSRRTPWKLLDIWPVDVNAVLLVELRSLRSLAERVGNDNLRDDLRRRMRALETSLGEHWDSTLGLFVDRVPDPAPAAWRPRRSLASAYPVWAGLGGAPARAALAKELLDPKRFATPMPLPTLAADEEGFDPLGAWNGSVFPEHAATAILALGKAGESLRSRFLECLNRQPALYECYDPLTGEPVHGDRAAYAQSSATAAAILELVCQPA